MNIVIGVICLLGASLFAFLQVRALVIAIKERKEKKKAKEASSNDKKGG